MAQSSSPQPRSLNRQIGPIGLLFTGLSIIGSGWLFAALYTAQQAGPAGIISWLIGGVIILLIALVYAELGAMLPVAGAIARIPYFCFGSAGGFVAGWLCWIAYASIAPVEVIAVLDYASNYLPWLTTNEHGERILTIPGLLVAIALTLIFTIINVFGVKVFNRTNAMITIWKLVVPIGASILLIVVGFRTENLTEFGGFAPFGIDGVFAAVSSGGIIFAFIGFRTILDMAGEAKNPQRDLPLAMVGTIFVCLVVYLFLQVAFIGAVPAEHLSKGWAAITETAAGGPFAALAIVLGLHWLAMILYADAIVSPAGSGLAFAASAARINYALSKSRLIPGLFRRLNRYRVPVWSLVVNFVFGLIILLPLPGWNQIVSFATTTAVLSFAMGPVAVLAMRYQAPDLERPFRLPYCTLLTAFAFVLMGFIVYWTGWETNWKIFLVVLVGLMLLAATRLFGRPATEPLEIGASAWLWPYYLGLAVISYLGNYGNGLGVVPGGLDMLILAVFSLAIFWLALRLRLSSEAVKQLIASGSDEIESVNPAP